MARVVHPITETKRKGHGGDEETILTHPAFGQISVFKTSGTSHMYGSDFRHQHYITIELNHSELHRNLSRDWAFQRGMITRFRMSEAQWAQFVSSIGNGGGTQVTLEFTEKDGHLPDIPFRDEGAEYIKEGQQDLAECLQLLEQTIRTVTENVQGLSKTKQREILDTLEHSKAKLTSSLPFVTKSFEKHLEKRVEKAKTEINAWMNATVQRAGLQAIAEKYGAPLQIEGPNDADHHQEAERHPDPGAGSDREGPREVSLVDQPATQGTGRIRIVKARKPEAEG